MISSTAAGCRYSQAHEAVDAAAHGIPIEKVAAIWEFDHSPLSTDVDGLAERAWPGAELAIADAVIRLDSLRARRLAGASADGSPWTRRW